jgi:uncharacterized protein (DUF305 family)
VKRVLQQSFVAACIGLAACAGRAAQPAAHAPGAAAGTPAAEADAAHAHHHAAAHDHDLPATGGPGFTAADVRFMQMMIVHHAQAIVMAELAPARGADDLVLSLARKIDISQRDEIASMEQWLRERGQVVPDAAQIRSIHMPGMLSADQLAQLAAARGRDFDRLFLRLMIQHHEGALLMVDELFASPRAGEDSEIFRFATDVAADQSDEIGVMFRMLEILTPTDGSTSR